MVGLVQENEATAKGDSVRRQRAPIRPAYSAPLRHTRLTQNVDVPKGFQQHVLQCKQSMSVPHVVFWAAMYAISNNPSPTDRHTQLAMSRETNEDKLKSGKLLLKQLELLP